MNKEERTKTLINNIKLNINEQNVYELGLCVEQWKQILDYIGELQQENKQLYKTIEELSQYQYDREEEDMMNYIIEQEEVFNDYSFMEEL